MKCGIVFLPWTPHSAYTFMDGFFDLGTGVGAGDGSPDDGWATDSSGGDGVDDLVLPGFLKASNGVYYPIEDPDDLHAAGEPDLVPSFAAMALGADPAGMAYAAELVFEGPVGWTKKTTATQPNPTKCNQTISCGCPLLRLFGLPVALLLKIFENCYKTSCNLLQPVLYSIYNILHM